MRCLFSLIQYCPDRGRQECANLGVVLVTPTLDLFTKLSPDNRIPKHRGFEFDDERLTMAKKAVVSRLRAESFTWRDPNDMNTFRKKEGNSIILTATNVVLTEDPIEEIENLYRELVEFPGVSND
jgi:hypothetical protein